MSLRERLIMSNIFLEKYKKSKEKKTKSEMKILEKYLNVLKLAISDNLNLNKNTKFYLTLNYDDNIIMKSFLSEDFKNLNYNSKYIIKDYYDKESVALEETEDTRYFINKLLNDVFENIDNIDSNNQSDLIEIDLFTINKNFKLIIINDKSKNNKTFILKNEEKIQFNKFKLYDENSIKLQEKKEKLFNEVTNVTCKNIVLNKKYADDIIDLIILNSNKKILFINNFNSESILDIIKYKNKNIQEFKKNITTSNDDVINMINIIDCDMNIVYYPDKGMLETLNQIENKNLIIFTDINLKTDMIELNNVLYFSANEEDFINFLPV